MAIASPCKNVDNAIQERARQIFRSGLQIVQVDKARLFVAIGPARQARQQMALADAGLAPQHHTNAAPAVARLAGQPR